MSSPNVRIRLSSPIGYAVVLSIQAIFLGLFLVDWKIPIVLTVGVMAGTVLLDFPVWAVGLMLASRVLSTGTLSFFSIGKMQIGLFEPVLLFTLVALALQAVFRQKLLLKPWPWQAPFFAMIGWRMFGLLWCTKFSDGLKEIVGLCVIVATASIVLAFIETWQQVKLMLWYWIGVCVLIGLLAQFGSMLGIVDMSSQWEAAAGGGRETGLGQQPNWFAMNLMFVIHAAAAFALIQKQWWLRLAMLGACVYIFFTMMTSGSRGGAYSLVIGGVLVALGQPLFRKWFLRLMALLVALFFVAAMGSMGDIGKGFNRISGGLDILFAKDIRGMNWQVCIDMFKDTYGLGIGPGGYVEQLPDYNWFIYESVYRYPHGIFWGELAHTGAVGLILLFSLVAAILRMTWTTIQDTKGTEAEMLAWAMPASMFGYWAWSFVEFSLEEKPFWEWLALYTALHVVARKAKEGKLPPIPSRIGL